MIFARGDYRNVIIVSDSYSTIVELASLGFSVSSSKVINKNDWVEANFKVVIDLQSGDYKEFSLNKVGDINYECRISDEPTVKLKHYKQLIKELKELEKIE